MTVRTIQQILLNQVRLLVQVRTKHLPVLMAVQMPVLMRKKAPEMTPTLADCAFEKVRALI